MKRMKLFLSLVLMIFMAMPGHCQRLQPNVQYATPEQVLAQYQAWFNNANNQLMQQTAGLPPIMQLQASISAIQEELSQWGGFLQQYYPSLYASRCAELLQRQKLLGIMMNGGGMPFQPTVPFPGVSPSGGRPHRRCIACKGGGTCRQCTGTGIVYASYGGSGSWTCTACKGTGRCTICNQ